MSDHFVIMPQILTLDPAGPGAPASPGTPFNRQRRQISIVSHLFIHNEDVHIVLDFCNSITAGNLPAHQICQAHQLILEVLADPVILRQKGVEDSVPTIHSRYVCVLVDGKSETHLPGIQENQRVPAHLSHQKAPVQ